MLISVFILIGLLCLSVLDQKFMKLPSALTSFLLFASVLLGAVSGNIVYGIVLLAFGLFLWDAQAIGGIADLKALGIIGFTINSILGVVFFCLIYVIISNIFLFYIRVIRKKTGEVPYLPVLSICYLILLGISFWIPFLI